MYIDTNIIEELRKQKIVTIGFSLGKDSLACALVLKELGVDFIPFYFFHVPDLDFVNHQIDYYSNFFKKEIIQMPHPMLYDTIRHQDYQPLQMAKYMDTFDFPKMEFMDMVNAYCDENGIKSNYDVVGMRSAESFNRRKFFERKGAIDQKSGKIYPIWNWKKGDVVSKLKEHNLKLSDDYTIWNRSWDGIKYQFLAGVQKHYPKDYEKIKEFYPLIELETLRYRFNHEHLG